MDLNQSATPVAFLYAADRERAIAFYTGLLGLTLISSDPFGDFLSFGPARIRLTVLPDWHPGQHPALGWNVDDIEAAMRGLQEKGVSPLIYDGMGQDALGIWTAPDGRARVAFFHDSEGNVLSLAQA